MTYVYTENDYLAHFGIKGMKWGVRRFRNEDGSLKPAGKKRYSNNSTDKSEDQEEPKLDRHGLTDKQKKALKIVGATAAAAVLAYAGYKKFGEEMDKSQKYYEEMVKLSKKKYDEATKQVNDAFKAQGKLNNLLDERKRLYEQVNKYNLNTDDISKKITEKGRKRIDEINKTLNDEQYDLLRKAHTGERYAKANRELGRYYNNVAENTLYAWKLRGYKTRFHGSDGKIHTTRLPSLTKPAPPTGNHMRMLQKIE